MAATRNTNNNSDRSLPALGTELWELVLAYLKQETIEPIKDLGRFVAWGVAGSVMLAIGLPLLALALLRALQVETGDHLTGHLTWVPYVGAIILSAVFAGLALFGMNRNKKKKEAKA